MVEQLDELACRLQHLGDFSRWGTGPARVRHTLATVCFMLGPPGSDTVLAPPL
jgi:hypothetical protein